MCRYTLTLNFIKKITVWFGQWKHIYISRRQYEFGTIGCIYII